MPSHSRSLLQRRVASSSASRDHPARCEGTCTTCVQSPTGNRENTGNTPHSKQYFAFVYFRFLMNSPPLPLSLAHSTFIVNLYASEREVTRYIDFRSVQFVNGLLCRFSTMVLSESPSTHSTNWIHATPLLCLVSRSRKTVTLLMSMDNTKYCAIRPHGSNSFATSLLVYE